jgi:uncharacterized membrane protein YfcA
LFVSIYKSKYVWKNYIFKSYKLAKMMLEDILFFVVAFISEIIGAIAGFGSSTIFLPLALFFVDFKTALILVAISHLFGNLGRVNFFRHGLDIKIIITFVFLAFYLVLLVLLLLAYYRRIFSKLFLEYF